MRTRTILVACANDVMPSLSTYLAVTGCRVQFAATALEILRKARRRLPDLIILDAKLPDMDVATVCDILSRLPSTGTVPRLRLAARGSAFAEVPRGGAMSGERPVAPFNSAELIGRVNELLELAATSDHAMAGRDAA